MRKKKTLQELTIKDNFMFAAVMMEEENCRIFLEMALGISIERVEVSYEKNIIYHPEYRGVRLDVFAKDARNTRYNVEIQVANQHLAKRTRYYHSQMDMELLHSGMDYEILPDTYVIFICDFDPLGGKKYRYTIRKVCEENPALRFNDGSHIIFLSTVGENEDEVPQEIVNFLKYVKADLKDSKTDFGDTFVRKLQITVEHIKADREMRERFMIFEEMLRDERAEGKAEGIAEMTIELLEELGAVSETLRQRIMNEKNLNTLKQFHNAAVRAESLEQFEKIFS